jgi:tungstate transport system substrate-binding protein
MMQRIVRALVTPLVSVAIVSAFTCAKREPPLVLLATTTSVANSGLLDQVLPIYEKEVRARVRVLPVGSGRALKMLEDRQADVIITHAPDQETRMLSAHPSWWYHKILYNDFVIVGPPADPAGVAESRDVLDAMHRIVAAHARFVSRGDQSGTHEREQQLWKLAGLSPGADVVIVSGAGMGATLNQASETGTYTLTDRGTYEQFKGKRELKELYSGDPRLLNTYAVVADPSNENGIRFARWMADGNGRGAVQSLLDGGRLRGFTVWPEGANRTRPDATPR